MRFLAGSCCVAALIASTLGCSSSPAVDASGSGGAGASTTGSGGHGGDGGSDNAPASWNRAVTPPSDDAASAARLACTYKAGALPAETQGSTFPMGDQIPVDTIVVMMLENRSFDHYFQGAAAAGLTDMEVAPADSANLDSSGNSVPFTRDKTYCFVDTEHGWPGVHQQIDGGLMDGFVTSNDETHDTPIPGIPLSMMKGDRAMVYYEEADIPFTYWLAKNFAVGDHYHASVPGPTWPNRMYLYAASSFGHTDNTFAMDVPATLFDDLTTRGVPWKIYESDAPCYGIFPDKIIAAIEAGKVKQMTDFFNDVAAGTLPPVVFIDAGFSIGDDDTYLQEDEHPPAIMKVGQRNTAMIVQALTKSPQWSRMAMFITYDEHGGLYDHVPPPKACPPDDTPPDDTSVPGAGFDLYGVRVPFITVSPYAKHGYVGHHVYDHTSIVRFIEARYTIPALSGRDANAEAPWDMFDFQGAPNATPGDVLIPSEDKQIEGDCKALWDP